MISFNVELDVSYVLSLDNEDDCRNAVVGYDEAGDRVVSLPCVGGEIQAWFDFCSDSLAIENESDSIEVWYFVYQALYGLMNVMIPCKHDFDVFDLNGDEKLFLRRVAWLEEVEAWYFQFDYR